MPGMKGRIKRSIKYIKTEALKGAEKVSEISHRETAWSGVSGLPKGHANLAVQPGCLVLEGGAFRGMYTSGVLDVFMENGLNFETTIGTSAGALNGLNYVAGEIGRSARINLTYRHDNRYIGMSAVTHGQSVLGLRFIVEDVCREIPLDFERLNETGRRLIVTASDCDTGEALYFEKGRCLEFLKAVRASASMPYISKMVTVEGHRCLDGGLAVRIPYEWALERCYNKIIVIRTRPADYREDAETEMSRENAHMFYKDFPKAEKLLCRQSEVYNRQCNELERLHADGEIYMLCPSVPIALGTLEGDLDKLAQVYYLGRKDALDKIEEIRAYLRK